MLVHVLSCREGHSQSGLAARHAGAAIGADLYLPNMATQDFLKCLSKPAMERAATDTRVTPRSTAKETRAALIAHVGRGSGTYVHPAARFAPTAAELASDDGAQPRSAAASGAEPGSL
jgi:ParB family transcriptional regulator, chromosome partitioning protein